MNTDIKLLRSSCEKWHTLITQGQLGSVLQQLLAATQKNGHLSLLDELQQIEKTYNLMRNYFLRGAADPQRPFLYHSICKQTHQLVERYFFAEVDQMSSASLTRTVRRQELPLSVPDAMAHYRGLIAANDLLPASAGSRVLPTEADFVASALFNVIWATPGDTTTTQLITDFVSDISLPATHREMLVGGVVLRLSQCFVPSYADLLLHLCTSEHQRVAARAMVGVLFVLMLYPVEFSQNTAVQSHLDAVLETPTLRPTLFQVFLTLERSRMAKDIEQCMTDSIMPEIMKMRSQFNELAENSADSITQIVFGDEALGIEGMPSIEKSMVQLANWQAEGMDVFLPSFRHMKDFHFFAQLSNWLLPFDKYNTALIDALRHESDNFRQTMSDEMMRNPAMCDSDKYSLLMSFSSVPAQTKEKLSALYREEINQTCEMIKKVGQSQWLSETLVMARQFVMDLYRIFAVHPRRAEFVNPFERFDNEAECRIVDTLFTDTESRAELGKYLIKHKHYLSAANIYDRLLPLFPDDFNLVCTAAHARLRADKVEGALELYRRAEMLNDQHANVKRRIARCYELLGNHASSLYYLEQATVLDPENLSMRYALAHEQIQLNKYDDALRNLFEIEYKQPSVPNVQRALARCQLMTGKTEQADNYFSRIAQTDRLPSDLIILGHIKLCQGQMTAAADAYRSYCQTTNETSPLARCFEEYKEAFAACGVSSHDVQMMKEAVLNT